MRLRIFPCDYIRGTPDHIMTEVLFFHDSDWNSDTGLLCPPSPIGGPRHQCYFGMVTCDPSFLVLVPDYPYFHNLPHLRHCWLSQAGGCTLTKPLKFIDIIYIAYVWGLWALFNSLGRSHYFLEIYEDFLTLQHRVLTILCVVQANFI